MLAVGEAATNAIKHGVNGRGAIYGDRDRIIARVCDSGPGIRSEDVPAAVLTPGYSTKVSLGMGYTLMLELVDTIWMSTGPEGTVVQLEKLVHPSEIPDATLLAALERF